MKKTDISKKRSFIVTAVKESEMIHVILTVLAIVAGIVIDYFLTKWEIKTFTPNLLDKSRADEYLCEFMVLMVFANPFLVSIIAFLIWGFKDLFIDMFYGIKVGIKKLKAIYRYCFIPLTEAEVRKCGFTSSDAYINYVLNELRYMEHNYISVKREDIRNILMVCIKVFPKNDLFHLQPATMKLLTTGHFESSGHFESLCMMKLQDFVKKYKSRRIKIKSVSASINDDGEVILEFKTKKRKTYFQCKE